MESLIRSSRTGEGDERSLLLPASRETKLDGGGGGGGAGGVQLPANDPGLPTDACKYSGSSRPFPPPVDLQPLRQLSDDVNAALSPRQRHEGGDVFRPRRSSQRAFSAQLTDLRERVWWSVSPSTGSEMKAAGWSQEGCPPTGVQTRSPTPPFASLGDQS